MSLETLLEAAEFLESRGKDADRHRYRAFSDRRTNSFSDASSVHDDNDFHDMDEKGLRETKSKNKSGRLSPIYVGPPDSFFTLRAGTREVHNKLEKNRNFNKGKELAPFISSTHNWLERNRRAHLKECFDFLKKNIPSLEDKRTSNLGILRSSLRYIQNLKRREREFESEMQKFAREKIILQEKMRGLKDELNNMDIEVDLNAWMTSTQDHDNETNSTSTATERGTPPPSDFDENDDDEEEAERLVLELNPSPIPKNKSSSNAIRPLIPIAIPKTTVTHMVNGVVPKVNQILMKTPPKKTIPITLSLSGPIQPVSYMANIQGTMPEAVTVSRIQGTMPEAMTVSRTPVTQLLHRTLTQRQALMKQTQGSATMTSAPLTVAQLKSPPLSRSVIPVSFGTVNSSTVSSLALPTTHVAATISSNVTNVALSKQATSAPGTVPLSVPYYMASVQKIAHPILVTSLMAPAMGLSTATTSTPAASVGPASTFVSPVPQKSEVKLEPVTTIAPQSQLNLLPTVVGNTVTQSDIKTSSANVPIRPIFAPNLLSGWPLLTTLPRSTVMVPSTNVQVSQSSVSTVTTTNTSTTVPILSLGQINHLTQMVGPMTVMSSGVQTSQSSLNQSQLNTMFASSPLLKQILPLGIPSSILQSGQVLGQVKPVVVVTVPNVVTQNPGTLASIALATTTS